MKKQIICEVCANCRGRSPKLSQGRRHTQSRRASKQSTDGAIVTSDSFWLLFRKPLLVGTRDRSWLGEVEDFETLGMCRIRLDRCRNRRWSFCKSLWSHRTPFYAEKKIIEIWACQTPEFGNAPCGYLLPLLHGNIIPRLECYLRDKAHHYLEEAVGRNLCI